MPTPRYHSEMGTSRSPLGPRTRSTASRATRVEAVSAEVMPLHTLPPMVPAARSWGPPAVSAASPSTGTVARMTSEKVTLRKVDRGPISTSPFSFRVMPLSSGRSWMETSRHPASLPSRTLMSTSVPPAMTRAEGSAWRAAMASATDFAR